MAYPAVTQQNYEQLCSDLYASIAEDKQLCNDLVTSGFLNGQQDGLIRLLCSHLAPADDYATQLGS